MFSKYDVYTTVQSLYCYPDSDVLKNKLNIKNSDELKQAEEEITALKQYMLMESPIKGRFTKTQLINIHRFLFEDIYPFAGHIRREQISKGDTIFFPPHLINQELDKVFSKLHSDNMLHETNRKCQIKHLSYIMSELNIIHPFREGNGRSIREMIRCMALHYGFLLDWSQVDRDTMLNAAVRSVVDGMAFNEIIVKCIIEG
ncbi:MAG: Fic family protein [Ruminococcus sp.]|uniref:Fic/DOC family protein n=1 Tax=Ruminococcus sp. TaxID=41978 RepID=UPI0025F9CD3D|nr:Fic family protein [Ruminococcus sp.]MBO4867329.1 Fic family protein [Ruminococcus sp.]